MDKEDDYECIDYGDNPPQLPKPLKMADIMGILPRKLDPGQLNISPVLPQRYSHVPSNGEKKFQPPSPVATRSQPPPVAAKSQPPPIPVKPPSKQKKVSSSGQSTPGSTKANYENYCKTFNQQKIYESAFPIRPPSPRPPLPVPTSPETKSDTLMLADFVKRHSKNLPMRVMVEEGFCGSEEKFVVSAGDVYDFHFLKNEKEVSIRDCGGMHFSIPLNSDIEFGLLYNPSNNFSEALKGHVFKSVLEFVSCKSYPRLVQVVTAQSNNKTPLEVNELLVIKKVGKSMLRKPFMKVYSITAKEEKTLQDDCVATFTTDPQRIKLHLPEILDAFPDSFPLDAMMFAPEGDADDFPPHLTTDMVTLTHTSILSSIIATTHWDDDDNNENDVPISIPIEMEIELSIVNAVDEDELYISTRDLLRHLDLSKVKNMNNEKNDASGSWNHSRLSKRVRQGYEFRGVDITMTDKIYDDPDASIPMGFIPFKRAVDQPLPPTPNIPQQLPSVSIPMAFIPFKQVVDQPLPPAPDIPQQLPSISSTETPPIVPKRGLSLDESGINSGQDTDMALYVNQAGRRHTSPKPAIPLPIKPVKTPPSPITAPKKGHSSVSGTEFTQNSSDASSEIAELTTSMNSLKLQFESFRLKSEKQARAMREDITQLTKTLDEFAEANQRLQYEVEDLRKKEFSQPKSSGYQEKPEARPPLPVIEMTRSVDPAQQEANVEDLRAMGVQEVLNLLDVMHLSQYKSEFLEETIDGEVLAECDEAILENELQIQNKIHRTRLMKVITGRHSPRNLRDGLDPYGGTF